MYKVYNQIIVDVHIRSSTPILYKYINILNDIKIRNIKKLLLCSFSGCIKSLCHVYETQSLLLFFICFL